MAPTPKGQTKPARSASGNAKKQPVPAAPNRQHIVPAIPLPMVLKQSNSNSTAAKTATSTSFNGLPAPSLEAVLVIDPNPVHLPQTSENEARGQTVKSPSHAAVSPNTLQQQQQPHLSPLQTNGVGHSNTDSSTAASLERGVTRGESGYEVVSLQVSGVASSHSPRTGANGGPPSASQPQSATSTTKPEVSSTFFPPTHQHSQHQHIGDHHHYPVAFHAPQPNPMHHYYHRQQMSNGGGMSFGFGSHTPSPVPLSSGFIPPPESRGIPRPNGHHHNHSNSNGFPGPINTHFRGDSVPMSTMDAYGTVPAPAPSVSYDSYPPGYGLPTPHNFHVSHTSGDHKGMENGPVPYPQNSSYASRPRHEPPVAHSHLPVHFPPFMPLQQMPHQSHMVDDGVMEGITYMRGLFNNRELSDCVLELLSAKGHHHPIKISGHKLIMARSPALKQHIKDARVADAGPHTITVEIDDPYIRSDAWWMAVQHLYLHPLWQPPPMLGNVIGGMDYAGDEIDQFAFCLGYAAAGHTLDMPDILIRGLDVAAHSLTWETIEAAMGFVLEGTVQRHSDNPEANSTSAYLEFGYGRETEILRRAIIDFLINKFPPNFEFECSVLDTPKITRIPSVATTTPRVPRPTRTDKVGPAITGGINRRQRLPKQVRIKFGDLPAAYPDDESPPHREPAQCSSVLSRILLNLPYDELCEVLTTGSHSPRDPGYYTVQYRYHAVIDVVLEREARRLRAVEAVRSEAVPEARDVQVRLSAPRQYTTVEEWDVLNWQEEVVREETPRIVRRWVPQFDVADQPTEQQQHARPSYDMSDSMV